ncbi:hypothetical protein [Mycolicibacterium bacteremicum]|uniref:Uncharacterized protein n=1 Tax=Mycolicibacterium bacteremicum TaxID=564198 RepID=A0A1W9YNK0_MYCBA|nr:hypothetical protein [Mycolicibacterium bacteremicum]MCV7432909.1 hypothetical protein [Mycolicibacterium bacteremicum]ORA01648.1 hypothetical protein BST17_27440 [Mycolicibacterium bacteremicum]
MALLENAKEQARQLVEKVAGSAGHKSTVQAVTIGRPRDAVVAALSDPVALSTVFGEIAEVASIGPNRLRWTFPGRDADDDPSWECVVTADGDGVKYTDVKPDSSLELVVALREAPQAMGTEVIGRISAPAPGVLTGPLLYKALYRFRALLLTGEIPTIARNPSARDSQR